MTTYYDPELPLGADFAADEAYRLSNVMNGHEKATYPAECFYSEEPAQRWEMDAGIEQAAALMGLSYTKASEVIYAVAYPDRDDASIADAVYLCLELADEGTTIRLSADGQLDDERIIELARKRKARKRKRHERYDDGGFGSGGPDGEGGDGGPSGGGDAALSANDGEIDRLAKLNVKIHGKAYGTGKKAAASSGKRSPVNPRQIGTGSRAHAPDEEDLDPEVARLRALAERMFGRGHLHDSAISAETPHGQNQRHEPTPYRDPGSSGRPQTGYGY